jgi:4,5-dihydroxyphthalate decarboxylase
VTLETMAGYSHEQGLTRRKLPLDELFVSVFQGRKRGEKFGI